MIPSKGSFTVVVPCRGRHDLVTQVVGRLVALGCPTVLVDDGTEPPLRPESHPLLTVLRQEPSGAGLARNHGVTAASNSEWVCFTDSDALWGEHTRLHVDHLLTATPKGTWVCGELLLPDNERSITANWMRRLQSGSRPPPGSSDIYLATGLLLCRREEFIASGGFIPSLGGSGAEDLELGQRFREAGGRSVFDPEWTALNYDRPFTFRRLVARQENYLRQRAELQARGVDVGDWMLLGRPGLRHRPLGFLGSDVVIRIVDAVGSLPDANGVGRLTEPVLRGTVSARMRRLDK